MYHIEIVKELLDNPTRYLRLRASGHNRGNKFNNMGIYYMHGMGCSKHNNCFEGCPFEDCKFQNDREANDLSYCTDRGNGIRVW